jgi:regulator of replication initiation timing
MNKQQFLQHLQSLIDSKMEHLHAELIDMQRDNASDTKSTAGDKHETGRAMMHLEMEKLSKQISEYQKQKESIHFLSSQQIISSKIVNGSLIQLSNGWFYLGVAFGKVVFNDTTVFCLSLQSPLGQQLLGKEIGDEIQVNNNLFKVLEVR